MFILRKQPQHDDKLANEMESRRKLLEIRERNINGIRCTALDSMSAPALTERDQSILDAAEIAARKLNESQHAASRCHYQPLPIEIDEAVPLYREALDDVNKAIDARKDDCEQSPLLRILIFRRDQLEQALEDYEPKGGMLLSEYDAERAQREREAEEAAAAIKAAEAEERAQAIKDAQDAAIAEREAKEERVRQAYEDIELD